MAVDTPRRSQEHSVNTSANCASSSHSYAALMQDTAFFVSDFTMVLGRDSVRLILHERSKRGSWDASQNVWQRQPNFQMRKYRVIEKDGRDLKPL